MLYEKEHDIDDNRSLQQWGGVGQSVSEGGKKSRLNFDLQKFEQAWL